MTLTYRSYKQNRAAQKHFSPMDVVILQTTTLERFSVVHIMRVTLLLSAGFCLATQARLELEMRRWKKRERISQGVLLARECWLGKGCGACSNKNSLEGVCDGLLFHYQLRDVKFPFPDEHISSFA